jgi:hypothetical protein
MLPQHIALVSRSVKVSLSDLTHVAAALQAQVSGDFAPAWGISATVDVFPAIPAVPLGYWIITIEDQVAGGIQGIHRFDSTGQPFAVVRYDAAWTITASHECLEMLADPSCNRLVAGPSPMPGQGHVLFLVEVCDPCEGPSYAYPINGVAVSDFYLPAYLADGAAVPGHRYSQRRTLMRPRQVANGGYLSWYEPVAHRFWQLHVLGNQPKVFQTKGFSTSAGLRPFSDAFAQACRRSDSSAEVQSVEVAPADYSEPVPAGSGDAKRETGQRRGGRKAIVAPDFRRASARLGRRLEAEVDQVCAGERRLLSIGLSSSGDGSKGRTAAAAPARGRSGPR